MSHFGHRVIGKNAAQREQTIQKSRANHFGSRVIGKIFERRAEIEEQEKDTFSDPQARQAKKEAAAEAAAKRAEAEAEQEVVEAPITANLNELEEALKMNPGFYEILYGSELKRAEGPRKGALRLFLAHELETEGLDREERKAEIEALLTGDSPKE
jgi:hypothetical protein